MIQYKDVQTIQELREILLLQEENLSNNLSTYQRNNEGFVTVKHDLVLLEKMNNIYPHTIAKYEDVVIGYALSMSNKLKKDIPILEPMFDKIEEVLKNENYIVMGQICINQSFRGKGVFKHLYLKMIEKFKQKGYDYIITEIDNNNQRSLKAHKKMGFNILKEYKLEDKNWIIVSKTI